MTNVHDVNWSFVKSKSVHDVNWTFSRRFISKCTKAIGIFENHEKCKNTKFYIFCISGAHLDTAIHQNDRNALEINEDLLNFYFYI